MNIERALRNPKVIAAAAVVVLLVLGRKTVAEKISYSLADKTRFDAYFLKFGRQYGVSPALLKATWLHESLAGTMPSVVHGEKFPDDAEGSKAESDGKSYGQMQITPDTANRPRVRLGRTMTVRDLNTATTAIELAARIFAELGTYYFPVGVYTPEKRLEYMIRAYNGGPGFLSTKQGRSDTPIYYASYIKPNLDHVLRTQPELA